MKNVTYIISDIDKAIAFEWIVDTIDKKKFNLSFILLNPGTSQLEAFLLKQGMPVATVIVRGKKDWPKAILKTRTLLRGFKSDIVHCHLFQANIVGLIAAKLLGVKRRIYSRHHSSLHHIYFRKGIMWDRLSNALSTHIVAISGIVKKILIEWEHVPAKKIVLIPHGFLLPVFQEVPVSHKEGFRQRHALADHFPIIGVISRFTEWKGVHYIIPAFQEILTHYPKAILLLLNAKGDYASVIEKQLEEIDPASYRLIPFESDIAAAYKNMDVFIHTPIDEHSEAFGQIYIEALAAGVPSIFTLSGIAPDFVRDGVNACVIPFKDSKAIANKAQWILNNYSSAQEMANRGMKDVQHRFSLKSMIDELEKLYNGD